MIDRLYVCPLTPGTDARALAAAAARELGDLPVIRPLTSTETWLTDLDKAQAEIAQACGQDRIVIDATPPDLPFGADVSAFHASLAPHVHAIALGLVDASRLSATELSELAALSARAFAAAHQPLAGILAYGASCLPDDPAVPLARLDAALSDDVDALAEAIRPLLESDATAPVSPIAYQNMLVSRAAAQRKRIVLPESDDERVLRAAARLVELDAVDVILLGEDEEVSARAAELGLSLAGVEIVSPACPKRRERYATELARLREAKGMTYDKALAQLDDISYFATMMVQLDDADGMVSGAIHTTAETIRPALQIIKTKPGTRLVSGAFLMLFADRVYLFADCAVTIDPSADELADIAVTSGRTAAAFGLDPAVALISYSTLGSGTGPTVDKVTEATALAREAAPDLAIDGPLQFDAAVDAHVARTKAPDSPVAGRATVFIFNHLDVGNCTYKAAQRMGNALAVGPLLQGLRKPVNDLSRGALVDDIVNTVIMTAVQAQG